MRLLTVLSMFLFFITSANAEPNIKRLTEQEANVIRDIKGCSNVYYNLTVYLLVTRHISEIFNQQLNTTPIIKSYNTTVDNFNKLSSMYNTIEEKLILEGYNPDEIKSYASQGTYMMANIISGMTIQMIADPENAKEVLIRLINETDRCDNLYLNIN